MTSKLWASIEESLLARGFAAGCIPLGQASDPRIGEWIDRGFHGTMAYLERHRPVRQDPPSAFPGYRSVIAVAYEYGDCAPPVSGPLAGNISRYALGDDYHDVLKSRLRECAKELERTHAPVRFRVFVDAGPLNEKLAAAAAGLGWIGKHTNLIDRRRGSYLFLGAILADADLGVSGSARKDRCGLCTRCIDVCPTAAIVAPYVLDARRCISYLTIEHKGIIPVEFRKPIGNRIFGCDDCQEVCPWNRFARREPEEPFRPGAGMRDTSLLDWLKLDEQRFKTVFRKSAVRRAGFVPFRRNVTVALGASQDRSVLPAALALLKDGDPVIRAHAVWAAARIDPQASEKPIEDLRRTESDPRVLAEIAAETGGPPAE